MRFTRPLLILLTVLFIPVVPFLFFGPQLESAITDFMSGSYLEQNPIVAGSIAATLLAADILLPIPSSAVCVFAGKILGTVGGTFACWVGLNLSCAIGYWIGRKFGWGLAACFSNEADLKLTSKLTERWGFWLLIVFRGAPLLAEATVLLMGVYRMSPQKFWPPVVFANLGLAIGLCALGEYAAEHGWFGTAAAISVAVPCTFLLMWIWARKSKAALVGIVIAIAFTMGCLSPGFSQDEKNIDTQALTKPFTTPTQALEMMTLPKGFKATVFAAEPDVHQPIAVTTDSRGRLWVVECYTYSDRNTNFDLSLSDRVVIFEDVDHDGKFDKRTIFWDEGKKLTGIEVGAGGVWLTAAPNLLFIPDANRDDRPDGPPKVILNGFEGNVIRHNVVNGLRWGPDGWLYGRHGIQATSHIGIPEATDSQRIPMNCGIWRVHPISHRFEKVAEGSTNPWGFDFTETGEMFLINTVIGHLFHVVPGARFRRMYGSHFNPHTYQVIEQTADHFHWDQGESHNDVKEKLSKGTDEAGGGHAHCGLMIYQGDNWPEQYRGRLFTANFHGLRLNQEEIAPQGNSFVATHNPDFMKTKDPWFRGVELIYGPDGGVFLLDWSDIGECHENDGIHRSSGRIFKITYEATKQKSKIVDLAKLSEQQLVELQFHENEWYVRMSRRVLLDRVLDGKDLSELEASIAKRMETDELTPTYFLRLLWIQYGLRAFSDKPFEINFLVKLMEHESHEIRVWAVRLLANHIEKENARTIFKAFLKNAQSDPSPLVRLYIASSLSQFEALQCLSLATALTQHESDINDRVQPNLIWYGIEPHVSSRDEQTSRAVLQLAKVTKFSQLRENIVRRLAHDIEEQPIKVDWVFDWLITEEDPTVVADAIRGMDLALSGWASAPKPKRWREVSDRFKSIDGLQKHLNSLGVVFGDGRAIDELKSIATSGNSKTDVRRKAIVAWAATKPQDLFEISKGMIGDRSIAIAVVKGLSNSEHPDVAKIILNQFGNMDPECKAAAINTLCTRPQWAAKLLAALENNRVPVSFVTAYHAQSIFNMNEPELRSKLTSVWGKVLATPDEKRSMIEAMKKKFPVVAGSVDFRDARQGRRLFMENCAACHTLFGDGGKTGPDLTGANRTDLHYLLENIIHPSGSVAEPYRASIINLHDGRTITGLVFESNDKTIGVQTPEEVLTIERTQIDEMRLTEKSVMPDGLLNQLKPVQIRQLLSYLMSETQVKLPPK